MALEKFYLGLLTMCRGSPITGDPLTIFSSMKQNRISGARRFQGSSTPLRAAISFAVLSLVFGACCAAASKNVSEPDVVFQAVPEHDSAERGNDIPILVLIKNRSGTPLRDLQITLNPSGPRFSATIAPLATVGPYETKFKRIDVCVLKDAEFQKHHLMFVMNYKWKDGNTQRMSAQFAGIDVQINRPFEEEAKGLPGGTAALLYLILPVMTVFFSYQVVDALRRGEGWKIPEFRAEYVAPAFLVAICVNFFILLRADQSFVYASPWRFAALIASTTAAGAVIPLFQWVRQSLRWRDYAFREDDTIAEYLRKAIAQHENGQVDWAKGSCQGHLWEGALLRQPDEAFVFGARLQITAKPEPCPNYEKLSQVIDAEGKIYDRQALLTLVKTGSVELQFLEKILKDGTRVDKPVVIEDLKDFVPDHKITQPIVTLMH